MVVWSKVSEAGSKVSETTWNKPPEWTGPEAALYQSFDDSDDLVLVEGTQQIGDVPLVAGKVRLKIFGTLTSTSEVPQVTTASAPDSTGPEDALYQSFDGSMGWVCGKDEKELIK